MLELTFKGVVFVVSYYCECEIHLKVTQEEARSIQLNYIKKKSIA